MNIDQLNRLPEEEAMTAFRQCCGASHWVERMVFARPFEDMGEVLETSDNVWEECDVDDYEEAFSFYPRIGDPDGSAGMQGAGSGLGDLARKWAALELKGVEAAVPHMLDQLARANTEYEEKFGYVFVVCAPGRSAEEIIAAMAGRMRNDPKEEIYTAAGEMNKITRLRLKKLLA